MTMDGDNRRNNFEQRAQTIIQVVICAVLAWGGSSLLSVREGLITVSKDLATQQATTAITTAQTVKDISDLKVGLEAVKNQAVSDTAAATAATTAATTAAAVAAAAVSTAAALAAGSKKQK